MIIYSTGQVNTEALDLASIRFDIMNRQTSPQIVRVLVWDTSTPPKTKVFDETFTVQAVNGDERVFTTLLVPLQFEAVVQTNDPNVVPHITTITTASTVSADFMYGDLFRVDGTGTVTLPPSG